MPMPQEKPTQPNPSPALSEWNGKFSNWLTNAALPLWWKKGADHERGGFYERLNQNGTAVDAPRRAHIQARQSIVFTQAGALGWSGPWREAAMHGMDYLAVKFRRADGLYRRLVSPDGNPAAEEATLYDQAFVLLAAATLYKSDPNQDNIRKDAIALCERIAGQMRHAKGGFKEFGILPYQSKAHAPLMEAMLAWREADDAPTWHKLANEIGSHCINRLLDPDTMLIYDNYDENWKVLQDGTEKAIHPGRHFLWAGLIERWARIEGDETAHMMAQRLFEVGAQGVENERGVTLDRFGADFNKCCETARLWPQAERLTTSLLFAETADELYRPFYFENAQSSAETLWRYLETPVRGLWHDRMQADGGFAQEPAPASSLYHLMRVSMALRKATAQP
jgi:mannose-1-phosphate guanylyltransferase / mannose-6-phosphate isomerase